jgi:response regulator NasT
MESPVLKVLLVDNTPHRASLLEQALSPIEDVQVICAVESPLELLQLIEEHKPDIVLIETDSPNRDVLEQLAAVSSTAPRPVVMFTGDAQDETIRAALRAGVTAYIVDGLAPGRIAPIMRVAIERFDADQKLRAQLEDAKSRLEDRKYVERAKGLLMKRRGLSEEEAFAALRTHAMERGVRLGEVAKQLIESAALLG